mmetsp:Transcript_33725/g.95417  ORF Transcript_33725/g.95417 Transcript_33725/m.95417 type:complete len:222 (+) Transcript_33725:70-735(+)
MQPLQGAGNGMRSFSRFVAMVGLRFSALSGNGEVPQWSQLVGAFRPIAGSGRGSQHDLGLVGLNRPAAHAGLSDSTLAVAIRGARRQLPALLQLGGGAGAVGAGGARGAILEVGVAQLQGGRRGAEGSDRVMHHNGSLAGPYHINAPHSKAADGKNHHGHADYDNDEDCAVGGGRGGGCVRGWRGRRGRRGACSAVAHNEASLGGGEGLHHHGAHVVGKAE